MPADNPLLEMENVVVTPHSAGGSTVAVSTAHKRIGEETARILRGTYPMSLANPSVCAKIPVRPPAVNV
jgi:phosphoglycerate dehydrogenase-like enzyme